VNRGPLDRFVRRMRWDARVRNEPSARATRRLLDGRSAGVVLDVGSGAFGLRQFLPGTTTIGADIEFPSPRFTPFVVAAITTLPFRSRAVDVVAAVDVLEYLPAEERAAAVRDLVRVAKLGVVAAFPHGELARAFDEDFKARLDARGLPEPEWLAAHLAQRYPTVDDIERSLVEAAAVDGRSAAVATSYVEPMRWGRLARRAALRSRSLFIAVSTGLGAMSRAIGTGRADECYRAVTVAAFDSRS
jgi:SAM-dependent methyltransferase